LFGGCIRKIYNKNYGKALKDLKPERKGDEK
jgi:hypothetical protein